MIVHTRRLEYRPPWSEQPNVIHVPTRAAVAGETARIVEASFGGDSFPKNCGGWWRRKRKATPCSPKSWSASSSSGASSAARLAASSSTLRRSRRTTSKRAIAAHRARRSPRIRRPRPAASRRRHRPSFRSRSAGSSSRASSDIDPSLAAMQALDLVHRENKTGDYIFKHALVRDAVYSSLLNTARSMLHLKIAGEIERRSANRLPEVAETLAYHYASTSRTDKAFLYLAMAAKKCLDIHSLDEADRYARRRWTYSNQIRAAPTIWPSPTSWRTTFTSFTRNPPSSKSSALQNAICRSWRQWAIRLSLSSPCTFTPLGLAGCNEFRACEALSRKALEVAERIGDLKAKTYAMNGILHASVFLACHSLETMERMGAECLALSRRLGDNSCIELCLLEHRIGLHFSRSHARGPRMGIEVAQRWAGTRRSSRPRYSTFDIGHDRYCSIGNYHEAARHAEECLRTAVTP